MKIFKNTNFFYSIMASLLIFASCKQVSNESKVDNKALDLVEEVVEVLSPKDTISVQKFHSWVHAWEIKGHDFNQTTLLKWFTMPLVDLTQVIGEKPSEARYHFGLDTTVTPYIPHLLLVGVDSTGKDMLDPAKGQYIYDVSRPCPALCGQ